MIEPTGTLSIKNVNCTGLDFLILLKHQPATRSLFRWSMENFKNRLFTLTGGTGTLKNRSEIIQEPAVLRINDLHPALA